MENLNLKIDKVDGQTLTILTGTAVQQREPRKIDIQGDIKSVNSFIAIRKDHAEGFQKLEREKAIVLVSKQERKIILHTDNNSQYGTTIVGKLEFAPELLKFHINENHTYTKDQLVKLLKFSRLSFANEGKHAEMLLAFQKIESTVNISAGESSDSRGNKENNFKKNVASNAPTEFILNIPVFKGFEKKEFRVEVCLDVTEGSARFWFESPELNELIEKSADQIIEENLSEAISCGLVIIYE